MSNIRDKAHDSIKELLEEKPDNFEGQVLDILKSTLNDIEEAAKNIAEILDNITAISDLDQLEEAGDKAGELASDLF